jgi:hypothetical protein
VFPIAASATSYPFRYADDDIMDLGALVTTAKAEAGDSAEMTVLADRWYYEGWQIKLCEAIRS